MSKHCLWAARGRSVFCGGEAQLVLQVSRTTRKNAVFRYPSLPWRTTRSYPEVPYNFVAVLSLACSAAGQTSHSDHDHSEHDHDPLLSEGHRHSCVERGGTGEWVDQFPPVHVLRSSQSICLAPLAPTLGARRGHPSECYVESQRTCSQHGSDHGMENVIRGVPTLVARRGRPSECQVGGRRTAASTQMVTE